MVHELCLDPGSEHPDVVLGYWVFTWFGYWLCEVCQTNTELNPAAGTVAEKQQSDYLVVLMPELER